MARRTKPAYGAAHLKWWAAIRAHGGVFAARDIDPNSSGAHNYLTRLTAAGLLEEQPPARGPRGRVCKHWKLLRDCGPRPPSLTVDGQASRRGASRRAMWGALRVLHQCTAAELAYAASTRALAISEQHAAAYLRALQRAEYLLIARKGKPGVPTRYVLRLNGWTGPLPPRITCTETGLGVYDPNLGRVVWAPPARTPAEEGSHAE